MSEIQNHVKRDMESDETAERSTVRERQSVSPVARASVRIGHQDEKRESPRDDYRLRRLVSLLDQSWRVDVRQPPTTRSVPERVRQP